MNNRWPPMLGVVGFDGGHKPAIALSIPRRKPVASEQAAEGTGACCYDDGTCDQQTQFDCTSAGGTFQGSGTDCDSVTCTGVCCEPGCVDGSTPDSCADDGGTWKGFGTTCADDPPPCPADCTNCDDLPPTAPTAEPQHINIVIGMTGLCGDMAMSGSITYDQDLGFGEEGPVGGHTFCAHNIFTNGFGPFWTGHFTATCTIDSSHVDFGGGGVGGLLGRDFSTCEWWLNLGVPPPANTTTGACTGCPGVTPDTIFQVISGAGDPSGVYVFTFTYSTSVVVTVTVTIT